MKKLLAMFMAVLFMFNLSINVFAADSEQTVLYGRTGDTDYVKIQYTDVENNITIVIGGGYRFTKIINTEKQTSQFYISEYSENFKITNNSRSANGTNSFSDLDDIIEYDRTTGPVSTTQKVKGFNVLEPRAGIIHRTSLEAIRAYMRHYSDGKYELRFLDSYHSTYSTHPNVNTYSYRFADAIDDINDNMTDIYFNLFGPIEYLSTLLDFFMLVQSLVEDGLQGQQLIDRVNLGIGLIPELVSVGFSVAISVVTTIISLGISIGDAKSYYNNVVVYSV